MNANDVTCPTCSSCRATFAGREDHNHLADLIEAEQPDCRCEAHSVSDDSPGAVGPEEDVHRLIVSPRDIDQNGFVHVPQFQKIAKNGLSVARSIASPEDGANLAADNLWTKPKTETKTVLGALVASVREIRATLDGEGKRVFCVYDQTVSRYDNAKAPVPTHAGIFLRAPPKGTVDRAKMQKDFAIDLRDIFLNRSLNIADLYNGALLELNARARAGEFLLPENPLTE